MHNAGSHAVGGISERRHRPRVTMVLVRLLLLLSPIGHLVPEAGTARATWAQGHAHLYTRMLL